MSPVGESEVKLPGGRSTVGVVRVGDTVRRPPTPNSDFVRRLLDHLYAVGFERVPRAYAPDELGRDTLDFLPGDVPAELSFHHDSVLSGAASLIRRYHDATCALVATAAARHVGLEVICHNDLSPCNFVFVEGLPTALIDFDAASPGARVYDLAYAAWLWLDLGSPEVAALEQRRRLALFLDAYGLCGPNPTELLGFILRRQSIAAARGLQIGDLAMSSWAEKCRAWTVSHRAMLEGGV